MLELLAEVAIAVVLVVGFVLFAFHTDLTKSTVFMKGSPFIVNTAFVFGYALKFLRPLWPTPKLWTVIIGLVLVHGITGWFLIRQFERVPLMWYVPVDIAEIWAILRVVEWVLPDEVSKYAPPPSHTTW